MDANEYTIIAQVQYPGLASKVVSKETEDGILYIHVITDELSDFIASSEDTDFKVQHGARGRYAIYESYSPLDLAEYLYSHEEAIKTWKALYLVEGKSVDDSLRLALANRERYERG